MQRHATILAKLSRPRLHDAVPRERLFALLDAAARRPVTLVAAPPGAGKTTLVASYLESRKLPGIWYQVDPGDADPPTLFHFLGLAERSLPGRPAARAPLPRLTPEYLADLEGFARRFFRALFERLQAPAVLVFANFQEAGDDSALHLALIAALEEVPAGVRVFLVSRHPPPDRYARLAANRQMALVGWDEIRFTVQEAAGVLAASGLPVDAATAGSLHERSGGWAAGLILLAEHLRGGRAVASIDDEESLTQVFAYFAGTLFSQAPEQDRRTLLQLGYLPVMRESHVRELAGPEAPRLLERLYRRNLFTDRRRGDEVVYTFHALFRAFLQHQALEHLDDPARQDTAHRAGQLLVAADMPEAAMPLYLAAGAVEAAASVILAQAPALIGQGRWKVVVEWIEALPAAHLANSPWLQHWLGTARIGVDPGAARAQLGQAYTTALAQDDLLCQVLCAAGMVEAYFLEYTVFTPVTPWIAVLERIFEPGFTFPGPESALRAHSAMLIAATYRQPDHPQVDACARRVRELLTLDVDVNLRVTAGTFLTIYGSFTGHLDQSLRAAATLTPLLERPEVHIFPRIFAWAVLCWYCANAGDHALGRQAVDTLENIARDEGMHIAERFACILGFFLDLDRGDAPAAHRRITRFEQIMLASHPYEAASIVNMKAWYGILTRDPAWAFAHAPEALRLYLEAGSIPHIAVGHNATVWATVEAADIHTARQAIAAHRALSGSPNMGWSRWGADAAEAMLALRAGDEAVLCERLERLFATDRTGLDQYGHQFSWCKAWAEPLAAEALRRHIAPERVCRFIREFGLQPPSVTLESWPWPVRIHALGGFELWLDGKRQTFDGKPPRRTLALLKLLVGLGGRDVKDYLLIDALWAQEEGDVARDHFRVAVHRLRRLLGRSDALLVQDGRISLSPALCWLDVEAFEALARRSQEHSDPADLDTLLALYRGELLAGEPESLLAAAARQRLAGHFVALVGQSAGALEQAGAWDQALALYRRGAACEVLAEGFHQGMMRCLLALGRRAEALAVHAHLRDTLQAALGIAPAAGSEALYRQAMRMPGADGTLR